jgi:hypothetical protein
VDPDPVPQGSETICRIRNSEVMDPELEVMDPELDVMDPDPELDLILTKNHQKNLTIMTLKIH